MRGKRILSVVLTVMVALAFIAVMPETAPQGGTTISYAASKAAVAKAKKKADAAAKAAAKAKKKYDAAKAETAKRRPAYEKAYPVYQKGSIGFFESVGAAEAVNALQNCRYHSYIRTTEKGASAAEASVDATSLRNMQTTFDHMRYLNALRQSLGLSELRVTDTLMAYAQADADYSDKHIGHAQQFDVGENVAWNYGSNPYLQWYDEEKAEYDQGNRTFSDIGHYLNCINSSYAATGYAICTRGSTNGWITYAQVFDFSAGGQSYTVEEYEARFQNYAGTLIEAIDRYDAAVKTEKKTKKSYQKALRKKAAADRAYQKARRGR